MEKDGRKREYTKESTKVQGETEKMSNLMHEHELEVKLACTDRCNADSCHDTKILGCNGCEATFSLDGKIQYTSDLGWQMNQKGEDKS